MKLDMRIRGNEESVQIVLAGNTFSAKDIIKENGFRFDKHEVNFCSLISDLGPIWYSKKTFALNELGEKLRWTEQIKNHNITVVVIPGGLI